jgi:hypothetical protein
LSIGKIKIIEKKKNAPTTGSILHFGGGGIYPVVEVGG